MEIWIEIYIYTEGRDVYIYMAGIPQEETPTQFFLFFSSKLMTSWPSGDIILNLYDKNI